VVWGLCFLFGVFFSVGGGGGGGGGGVLSGWLGSWILGFGCWSGIAAENRKCRCKHEKSGQVYRMFWDGWAVGLGLFP